LRKGDESVMGSNKNIRDDKVKPGFDLPVVVAPDGTIRHRDYWRSGRHQSREIRPDDRWDANGVAESDASSETDTGESRRDKLIPLTVKSHFDERGIHYSANTFWRVWNFIPHRRPQTPLEVAFVRVQKVQALLHSLYENGVKRNDYDAVYSAKHQQAGIVEALRIIAQEIALERGADKSKMEEQEKTREWEEDY